MWCKEDNGNIKMMGISIKMLCLMIHIYFFWRNQLMKLLAISMWRELLRVSLDNILQNISPNQNLKFKYIKRNWKIIKNKNKDKHTMKYKITSNIECILSPKYADLYLVISHAKYLLTQWNEKYYSRPNTL